MATETLKIAIVGGGIIGLTTGLALQKSRSLFQSKFNVNLDITIISDEWTPNTTGDVSAGLIYPYLAGPKTPKHEMELIFKQTMHYFKNIIEQIPDSGRIGVTMITLLELHRDTSQTQYPVGYQELLVIKQLDDNDLRRHNFPECYKSGFLINTYLAQPNLLLPYLMTQFRKSNGKMINGKIEYLSKLLEDDKFHIVVNCTGIGCKLHLKDVNDPKLKPVRGQVIRVEAPWITQAIIADEWYILPQNDCIVLGGTKDLNKFELRPNEDIANKIWENCCKLNPSIRSAKRLGNQVGLRPFRDSLRIEVDDKNPRIFHNYGHGGSGVTLCWGSALKTVHLIDGYLQQKLCPNQQ